MTTEARREPLKVIVDSNALFVPIQFKIDVVAELERLLGRRFELILISPVKRELETLVEKGSPKMRRNARYALEFAEKLRFVEVADVGETVVDDVVVRVAAEWRAAVFTNDVVLRRRLRDISVPVIYVRQKSRLEVEGSI